MTREEVMEAILQRKRRSGICHTCGDVQSHQARWCPHCGSEYCSHNHTYLDGLRIGRDITFEGGKYVHYLRPEYLANIVSYWDLRPNGITIREFIDYMNKRLENDTRVNESA